MDMMLSGSGSGYFRGSSILVSGTAGTGKTSFAAYFVNAACKRGEKCLYFAFEETQAQIIRNMESIGIDLEQWVKKGLLKFHITRPALYGLETHLVMMEDDIKKVNPKNVVIDPITDFSAVGHGREVKSMLTRLNDMMKARGITVFFTDLVRGDIRPEHPEMYISSLIDTWIMLRNFEHNGERNRGITILKSRGMPHSNQIKEFLITSDGIDLVDPYIGPAGVIMGSGKLAQEAKDEAAILEVQRKIEHTRAALEEMRRERDAKGEALKSEYAVKENELMLDVEQTQQDMKMIMKEREAMSLARKSDEKGKK
jgi:circadian clock protein KaiC